MPLGTTNKLILAFVTLILGVVLVGVIATQGLLVTDKIGVAAESHVIASGIDVGRNKSIINSSIVYTLTNAPTGWKVNDCPITAFVITNSSGDELTITTDYLLTASAGTFTFVDNDALNNTIGWDNVTLATYDYCGDDYMNLGWGRTGINLVSGFFALSILLISIGLFYSVAKDTGMI